MICQFLIRHFSINGKNEIMKLEHDQSVWNYQSPNHFIHFILLIIYVVNIILINHLIFVDYSDCFFHHSFSLIFFLHSSIVNHIEHLWSMKGKTNKYKVDKIAFDLLWNDLNETIKFCCNCCFEEKWKNYSLNDW